VFVGLFWVMTPEAFGAAELGWHDFFLASAGASAALLGLLFVGVSINLSAIAGQERVDLRGRAGQAFANLIFVLLIALIMLIPDPDPGSIALSLAVVAGLGFVRVAPKSVPAFPKPDAVPQLVAARASYWMDGNCRCRPGLHRLENLVLGGRNRDPEFGHGRVCLDGRGR
jgi:hypothetical protein